MRQNRCYLAEILMPAAPNSTTINTITGHRGRRAITFGMIFDGVRRIVSLTRLHLAAEYGGSLETTDIERQMARLEKLEKKMSAETHGAFARNAPAHTRA
jgi:hypothetical protein